MNPVAMTIINPRKEFWPSRRSNQQPPILKSATLPTELWGSAKLKVEVIVLASLRMIPERTILVSIFVINTNPLKTNIEKAIAMGHFFLTLFTPKLQILDSSTLNEFANDNLKFDENGRITSDRSKTLWEKEKLLARSNFSFSHNAFKRLVQRTRKNQGFLGKRLKRVLPWTMKVTPE